MRVLPLLLLLAIAIPARADDELTEARRLESSLEYEKALAIVERTLAHGGADPARTAELHLLAGQLAAGLDRPVIAEEHFAKVLAVRPDTTLPDGTSPKLTTPFDAARSRTIPLRVTAPVTRGGVVAIVASPDPLHLVSGTQVHVVDSSGHHSDVREPHAMRVQLPAGTTALEIAALDATGNHVWVMTAPQDAVAPTHEEHPIETPRSTPLIAHWSTWGVASGVALAAGGLCAWRFGIAQDQWNTANSAGGHDFSELVAIEDRGRRWSLGANISFGIAAAAGITATVLYLTHTNEPPVTIIATPGSIGVAGRF